MYIIFLKQKQPRLEKHKPVYSTKCLPRPYFEGTLCAHEMFCAVRGNAQSWALEVFLNFFYNKKLFFSFYIKLI